MNLQEEFKDVSLHEYEVSTRLDEFDDSLAGSEFFFRHRDNHNDEDEGEDGGGGESSTGDGVDDSDPNTIPDIRLLNIYCARVRTPAAATTAATTTANNNTTTSSNLNTTTSSNLKNPESNSNSNNNTNDSGWELVREWLSTHDTHQIRKAAEQVDGTSGLTALHFACRHVPPMDVIETLLSVAKNATMNTATWVDNFGWLPIHYACASGSSSEVIKALVEAYPESRTMVDKRGRTPLHFALGDKPAAPDVIFLLASSGAASYADEIGMLPLHYACAFGASEETIYVLTDAYADAIHTKDLRQRTPLHFALSNAGRKTVPSAVRLLLNLNPTIVNSLDGSPLPLRVLSDYTHNVLNKFHRDDDKFYDEKRDAVAKCLEHLLNAHPKPTADFLTTLQTLPNWLSEKAVVMPSVQTMLNEKISRRFPTAVLMMDLYVMVMIITSYSYNVVYSIHLRFLHHPTQYYNIDDNNINNINIPNTSTTTTTDVNIVDGNGDDDDTIDTFQIMPMYLGAVYFAIREIVQIISLISLKSFSVWMHNASNYFNIAFIVLVYFWADQMNTGKGNDQQFRIGAAISVTALWLKLLAYLRNMMIDFAVFVGGVFYVVRRLAAFLTALIIILVAFSQMFHTISRQSTFCIEEPNNFLTPDIILDMTRCSANAQHAHCNLWTSFLYVFTMLIGDNVDETKYLDNKFALVLFVVFVFLVVILLANVLIAIVTDSYKVIQDQRAAIVFWTNRLDFVAEMDAIANGPWKRRLKEMIGKPKGGDDNINNNKHGDYDPSNQNNRNKVTKKIFGEDLYNQCWEFLFEDEVEAGIFSLDFVLYTIVRIFLLLVFVPLWFVLGLLTVGWCWPPQIREAIFTSTVFKHSSDSVREDELRKTQVKNLQTEVVRFKEDILQELVLDRTQVLQMKSQVAEQRLEIANEMKDIKKIVAILFERRTRVTH